MKLITGALVVALTLGTAGAIAQQADGSIGGLKAKFVDVNGVKARYYEAGQGEPMVLIHGGSTGGSSTANVWSRNIPGLAKRFHVFAIDRLGSGLSGNPANHDYGDAAQVEFVHQFIKAMNLTHVHLVGHSAGGGVALYTAVAYPDLAKTLTIVAHGPENPPAANGDTKLQPELAKCPNQEVYEGLKCRVEKLAWGNNTFDKEYWDADIQMATTPKSKEARAKVAASQKDPGNGQRRTEYREKVWAQIKSGVLGQMPVLIYSGKQDVLDWGVNEPVAMMRGELGLFDILGTKNRNIQMIIVNEGGHFMYREHPDLFNADLINFIDFWNKQAGAARKGTQQ
jgi:pimeloyl-ACP methyl ester carboxylesterase